ncbi:MAG: cytochrome c oxidase assembly protein [Phycisphaerae bacterium]
MPRPFTRLAATRRASGSAARRGARLARSARRSRVSPCGGYPCHGALATVLLLLTLHAPTALAHGGEHHDAPPTASAGHPAQAPPPPDYWRTWVFDPVTVTALACSAVLYAAGAAHIWRSVGAGRGLHAWEAGAFATGWLTLVVALVSPLHPLGEMLFFAHMIQHELLMLVAAPLLVLGRPVVAFLSALPRRWAGRLARAAARPAWRTTWHTITRPLTAWAVHAAVLWVWHAPPLMDAVLHDRTVHALQHVSFFASALLFWWAVIDGGRNRAAYGAAVLYLFTTAVHSGLLGVLITYASAVLYPTYLQTAPRFGWAPLDDQQVGGVIMWIPACTVYIVAGLILFAAWLRESDRRVARWQPTATSPPPPLQAGGGA